MPCHPVCCSCIEVVSGKKLPTILAGNNISLKKQPYPVCVLCNKFYIMGDHKDRQAMLFQPG